MTEPNPTPAFRLGCGTVVSGYRLVRCLGRGWESTSYLATEVHSGVVRRLKFYRQDESLDLDYLGHVGVTFEALAPTGAVPTYHHMGVWRRGRDSVPFLVFEYVEGRPLGALLQAGRWRRGWSDRRGLQVLAALADKLAAIHAMGLAAGDVTGDNVLVTPDSDVRLVDIEAGWPGEPNTDMADDGESFFMILGTMAEHEPVSPLMVKVRRKLERFRARKRWTGAFASMAAILGDMASDCRDTG